MGSWAFLLQGDDALAAGTAPGWLVRRSGKYSNSLIYVLNPILRFLFPKICFNLCFLVRFLLILKLLIVFVARNAEQVLLISVLHFDAFLPLHRSGSLSAAAP
jgi:hypothetical protein